MKITFVLAAADLSGGNRVISIYAQRLQSRGHQVTVVSRPWPKGHAERQTAGVD